MDFNKEFVNVHGAGTDWFWLYMNKHYKNCSETGPFVSKLWELKYEHFPQILNI